MLNQAQQAAYNKGKELYVKYILSEETTPNTLDMLYDAFELLGEHVDDVEDIDFRLIFALVVQAMQESDEFNLSEDCIDTKVEIFLQILKWVVNLDSSTVDAFTTIFKMTLCHTFETLGTILLAGKELPQNDYVAWICYQQSKRLGHMSVDESILDLFEKGSDGKMVLKPGVPRPE